MTRRSNGAVPPHEVESERAVLAASMISTTARDAARDEGLVPDDFFGLEHQRLWRALLDADDPTDVVGLARALRATGSLGDVGGAGALAALVDEVPSVRPAHLAAAVERVIDAARRRRVIDAAHRVAAAGYDPRRETSSYLAEAEAALKVAAAPVADLGGPLVLDGPAIAGELGPLEYLVAGLGLVAGGGAPHLVAGYGYSGKTLALQAMLLQLAAGRRVWGAYDATARRVLHVDLEQGERLSRRRYQRLAAALEIDLAKLGDALGLAVMPAGLTLAQDCAPVWHRLMAGRDIVVIDSLRAATPGQDENDSSMRDGLDMLGHVGESTGCRPIVIHHARKPSGRPDDPEPDPRMVVRGSSAIFDGCDSVYVFAGRRGEPVAVAHVKGRSHGDLVEDLALAIEDITIDGVLRAGVMVSAIGGEAVIEAREARAAALVAARVQRDAARVLDVVQHTPGIGTVALRAAAAVNGTRLAAALSALAGSVEIRETRDGRRRLLGHWAIGGATAGSDWADN